MKKISTSNMLREGDKIKSGSLDTLCFFGIMLSMSVLLFDMPVFAETSQTTVIELNNETNLEKTVTVMNVPENNSLPWGSVKGKVNDAVQGYPVIIQFFKSIEDDPIHVAQVNLKGDNSFEYKFRVLSIDEGTVTHYFEGEYTVKIFKVINAPKGNLDSV